MRLNLCVAAGALTSAVIASTAYGQLPVVVDPPKNEILDAIRKGTSDGITVIQRRPEQQAIEQITKKLSTLPLDILFQIKMTGVCESGYINCLVLTTSQAIPLVDIEIDKRKAAEDAIDKQTTMRISVASLAVSVCAFGFSVFGAFRKGGKATAVET